MRPFVIQNPAAGRGLAAERLGRLLAALPGVERAVTAGPGEASRLARRAAAAGYDPIVVAGGDGLVAEVVNGLAPEPDRVRLAVVPTGTGNDFARGLGLGGRWEEAVAAIAEGRERRVDAARLRTEGAGGPAGGRADRWLVNALVTGLAGRVARRAGRARKRRWGSLAYRIAALPELARARARDAEEVEIEAEGSGEPRRLAVKAHAVAVLNGGFAGGGLRLVPEARPDDGCWHLLVLPDLGPVRLAGVALRLFAGAEVGEPLLRRRIRRVRIAASGPAWLNADGEDLEGGWAQIEVVPGALRILGAGPGGRSGGEGGRRWDG